MFGQNFNRSAIGRDATDRQRLPVSRQHLVRSPGAGLWRSDGEHQACWVAAVRRNAEKRFRGHDLAACGKGHAGQVKIDATRLRVAGGVRCDCREAQQVGVGAHEEPPRRAWLMNFSPPQISM